MAEYCLSKAEFEGLLVRTWEHGADNLQWTREERNAWVRERMAAFELRSAVASDPAATAVEAALVQAARNHWPGECFDTRGLFPGSEERWVVGCACNADPDGPTEQAAHEAWARHALTAPPTPAQDAEAGE